MTTELDDPVLEEGVVRPIIHCLRIQATHVSCRPSFHLSQTHGIPTEGDIPVGPVAGSQKEMSRTLDRAEEAMETMDTMKAWKSAIDVVKQVMDTVDPIAEV